jgi:hypothetical protein
MKYRRRAKIRENTKLAKWRGVKRNLVEERKWHVAAVSKRKCNENRLKKINNESAW